MTAAAAPRLNDKREIFGWTMYDWANSAFSTTVVTVFLGPYLTSIAEAAADANGFLRVLGFTIRFDSFFTYCVSISVMLQVFFLPVLGAIADYGQRKKQLLAAFTFVGSFSTMGMYFAAGTAYMYAGVLFLISNLAFGASIVIANAFLAEQGIPEIDWSLPNIAPGNARAA